MTGAGETLDLDRALADLQSVAAGQTPRSWQHPGQLAWSARFALPEDLDHGPAHVVRVDGRPVGWAWAESADWMEWCVDPGHDGVAGQVLAWFLGHAAAATVRTMTLDTEHHLATVLEAAGFVEETGPWFSQQALELAGLVPVPAVPGYAFRAVRPGEHDARAACHRASWSATSRVSGRAYERLMATPPYRPELDWVAVTPDDEMVASCCVWLDDASGVALVEPVGCHPGHRRRGLASAVSLAALHAARAEGGTMGLVRPRGDDDYPAPARVYRGIGFRPGPRTRTWALTRG